MPTPMLWKLHYASPETLANAGVFAAALRQHLQYTPAGLTSMLLQIDQEQSAYLMDTGCSGCALDHCVPGCRVDLLRRVLSTGYAESHLSLVKQGLLPRPYTRAVIGWPASADARPLDASILQGWRHARLALHWRSRSHPAGLRASVVLHVGDGADDPLDRLRTIGWQGRVVPVLLGWRRGQPRPAPRWMERPWRHDPYVLTPVSATTHWLMSPPARRAPALDARLAVGYSNASTIVHHVEEAGARVELLDLEPDGWTAEVAATTVSGSDPRPIWDALRATGGPLQVCDAATGALALDPARSRPTGVTPALLQLGARRDGPCRWRPLSATHHLVLAGPVEGGVILGMVAPAMESHPDLRVGVLDLTAAGTLDVALLDLPGRLLTQDSRNVPMLLSAIGSLPDQAQPVLVVLHADDADAAATALLPCLRAALYRPVSVLLVVPTRAAIPTLFQARCPVVDVRQRVAQWQAPEGAWDWAQPTVLRLPWRDPQLSWLQLAGTASRQVAPLPALNDFWAVPLDLRDLSGSGGMGEASRPAAPADLAVPPEAPPSGRSTPPQGGRSRRCRVYDVPARASTSDGDPTVSTEARVRTTVGGGASQSQDVSGALPAVPGASGSSAPAPVQRSAYRSNAPLPPLPIEAVPTTDTPRYTPREDTAGNLIVDPQLVALTLQWAEQIDPENQGVSITRFKSGVGLPSKAHSFQLRDALRLHGLIRRELKKEGWYRLLTVEEAVTTGKLPPGPWYTSPVKEPSPETAVVAEPADASAGSVDPPGDSDGAPGVAEERLDVEVQA